MNTPVRQLRQYWNQWLQRRHPRGASQRLSQNRVYIFLSGGGAVFCVMLLALLGGAVNYDLALAYLLVFLLASMALVSLFHTFRNLLGLTLVAGHTQPCFAGETARFEIVLQNDNALQRQNLRLRYGDMAESTDVAPLDGGRVWLGLPAERRGWLQVPRLRIETDWPLGIFRSWSYAWFDQRTLVYPRPEVDPPALPLADLGEGEGEATRRGQDDFAGLRPFQRGDSPRHIAWKAAARDDTLMAKEFHGTAAPSLWLDWDQLSHLPTEAALSRLTAWVLMAESEGQIYGLRMPGCTLPPAQGMAHRDSCLAALALFGESDAATGAHP